MGIMGCYPDKRAIENELGGKWEKFFEYTWDSEHKEGFDFPTDVDGTPLHLKGVYIRFNAPNHSTNVVITVDLNSNISLSLPYTVTTASDWVATLLTRIDNGIGYSFRYNRAPLGSFQNEQCADLGIQEDFTSIKLTPDIAYKEGTKIEIYVMRNV